VLYERFLDARAAGQPESVLQGHLNAAAAAYQRGLDLLPANANPDLATFYHQLGSIYTEAGDYDTALTHFQGAIRLMEAAGNRYRAGATRYTVAVLFARAGRAGDALLYARAALADFASYGAGAGADIEKVQRLIARLNPDADPSAIGAP
jgi:tetratricopeptide (TPR) repeat protein